jgi:hypothetical protein
MKTLLAITMVSAIALVSVGQEQKTAAPIEPKTKLEAFEARTGAVIIRGFSTVGTIRGRYETSVEIECKEFTDASSGKREFGVSIEVKQAGRIERKDRAYIDYDEIDSLVKGIEYISKIEKSVTKLDQFQADYKTKGELRVSTFSDDSGKIQTAIHSGQFGGVTAYLSLEDLASFKKLVQQAKEKLDSIKG